MNSFCGTMGKVEAFLATVACVVVSAMLICGIVLFSFAYAEPRAALPVTTQMLFVFCPTVAAFALTRFCFEWETASVLERIGIFQFVTLWTNFVAFACFAAWCRYAVGM